MFRVSNFFRFLFFLFFLFFLEVSDDAHNVFDAYALFFVAERKERE